MPLTRDQLAIRASKELRDGFYVNLGIGIPDRLLQLGRNGCEPGSLGIKKGWSIVQQFTVAELRKEAAASGVGKMSIAELNAVVDSAPSSKPARRSIKARAR